EMPALRLPRAAEPGGGPGPAGPAWGGGQDPRRRPEPGADHGLPPGAPGQADRHQPHRRAGLLPRRGRPAAHRAAGPPCPLRAPRGARPDRPAPRPRGGAHRPCADPHPRHLLRQPRPCRPGLRMVLHRPGAGCGPPGAARGRRAAGPGRRLVPIGLHHRPRPGRVAGRGEPPPARPRLALRLRRVQPPRRRLRPRHGGDGAASRCRRPCCRGPHRPRRRRRNADPGRGRSRLPSGCLTHSRQPPRRRRHRRRGLRADRGCPGPCRLPARPGPRHDPPRPGRLACRM
ncbi:MAG: Carbon monoxide dehydrogenase medium chain, partial [uncultured Craurococcus sp.]